MSSSSVRRKRLAAAVPAVLVFIISFAVFDRLLLHGLRAWAGRYYAAGPGPSAGKAATVSTGEGDGEILIFGTSRSARAFDQETLAARLGKKIIKNAAAGRYPRYFDLYYLRYRRENRRPAAVVYGMDYFMFEKKTLPSELRILDPAFEAHALNPGDGANDASPLLSRLSRLFRKKPEIDDFLGGLLRLRTEEDEVTPPAADQGKGRDENPDHSPPLSSDPRKRRPFEPRRYQARPGAEGKDLAKLLTVLEKDGVPVVLVFIPDFIGTNETNFEQARFKEDVGALAGLHGNAAVLDFNRPDRFDLDNPDLFRDGGWGKSNSHLNFRGKAVFNRLFAEAVRPFLRSKTPGAI